MHIHVNNHNISRPMSIYLFFFFFQAEDGIRDLTVTGVQTCALPISHPMHDQPFLVCTSTRESHGNYQAYNPAGPYMGAYQFLQSTWNSTANHAGRTELIAVPPNTASEYD